MIYCGFSLSESFFSRAYISKELTFIPPEQSRYADVLRKDKRFGSYPIGLIGDVEVAFLHYHSEQKAKEKWKRRCKRINWDKLIVKFNDQNGCTDDHVRAFANLSFKNKCNYSEPPSNSQKPILLHKLTNNILHSISFDC